jgi:hypothetical protein
MIPWLLLTLGLCPDFPVVPNCPLQMLSPKQGSAQDHSLVWWLCSLGPSQSGTILLSMAQVCGQGSGPGCPQVPSPHVFRRHVRRTWWGTTVVSFCVGLGKGFLLVSDVSDAWRPVYCAAPGHCGYHALLDPDICVCQWQLLLLPTLGGVSFWVSICGRVSSHVLTVQGLVRGSFSTAHSFLLQSVNRHFLAFLCLI